MHQWKCKIASCYSKLPRDMNIQVSVEPFHTAAKQEWLAELHENPFQLTTNIALVQESTTLLSVSYENFILQMIPPSNLPQNYLSWYLTRILKRCICLTQVYNIKEPIHVWIIPNDMKRHMPTAGQSVEPQHINGGYTYRMGGKLRIVITRWEEFGKVILHEVLHHSYLDMGKLSASTLASLYKLLNLTMERCGQTYENCQTMLRPNEALVEFWAELHQMLFLSLETGIAWDIMFVKEKQYALAKAKQLLEHQNTLYGKKWQESTHAFSYIILRAFFMQYILEFLQLDPPYHETSVLQFIQTHWKPFLTTLTAVTDTERKESLRMTRIIGDF
jgi:hypothetical protein